MADPKATTAIRKMRSEAHKALKCGGDPFAVYKHLREIEDIASAYLSPDEEE